MSKKSKKSKNNLSFLKVRGSKIPVPNKRMDMKTLITISQELAKLEEKSARANGNSKKGKNSADIPLESIEHIGLCIELSPLKVKKAEKSKKTNNDDIIPEAARVLNEISKLKKKVKTIEDLIGGISNEI